MKNFLELARTFSQVITSTGHIGHLFEGLFVNPTAETSSTAAKSSPSSKASAAKASKGFTDLILLTAGWKLASKGGPKADGINLNTPIHSLLRCIQGQRACVINPICQ